MSDTERAKLFQEWIIVATRSQGLVSYHHSPAALDVTQCQGDVDEHNSVADHDGADVTVALSVNLILNTPLCTERYGQVGV